MGEWAKKVTLKMENAVFYASTAIPIIRPSRLEKLLVA
jgi:hypothetical protein